MSSSAQILPAGAGYGVVIGVGFFFAFVSIFDENHNLQGLTECQAHDGYLSSTKQIHKLQHQDE